MTQNKSKLEENSIWILPENLQKDQEKVMQKTDLDSFDNRNDFESYRLLIQGRDNTGVETHNLTGAYTKIYAEILKKIIDRYNSSNNDIKMIADIGCGAGFLSAQIKSLFNTARIYGYDIAVDAIRYAKERFKEVNFSNLAFEPGISLPLKFDMIHTREFYPFTRTNSADYQISCIDTLLKNLNKNGILIISVAHTDKCIINNLNKIKKDLSDKTDIFKILYPAAKIYSICPILSIAGFLTNILYKLTGKKNYYILLLRKK